MKPILKLDVGGCFAFSPDGEMITVAKKSPGKRMAPIVSVRDGQEVAMVDRLQENTRAIAWSPDGKTIAYGAMYGRVTICDANTGDVLHKVKIDDTGEVLHMDFVPGTNTLVHATMVSKTLREIDVSTGVVTDIAVPSASGAFQADTRLHCGLPGGRYSVASRIGIYRAGVHWNNVDVNPAGTLVALLWRDRMELRSWPSLDVLGQWPIPNVRDLIPLIGIDPTGRYIGAALGRSTFVYAVDDLLPEGYHA